MAIPIVFQLFRRVAAALPGMDSTENKPPEDSILFLKLCMLLRNYKFQFKDMALHASIYFCM